MIYHQIVGFEISKWWEASQILEKCQSALLGFLACFIFASTLSFRLIEASVEARDPRCECVICGVDEKFVNSFLGGEAGLVEVWQTLMSLFYC